MSCIHQRLGDRHEISLRSAACAGRGVVAMLLAPRLEAQSPPPPYDPIVVTATRNAERAFDVPASVDVIDGAIIRGGQPAINLSESLVRVPGVFAANRQNFAQDLQISSRGFGARATFGVRGVRLYQDDIPVTMPDGQGQTAASACCRRAASRCCAARSPRFTAMLRAA